MASRRNFLKYSLAVGAGMTALPALARIASPEGRSLSFHNLHTGEQLRATYWTAGDYVESELAALNWFLRDYRCGEQTAMDPRLFDVLSNLQRTTGSRGVFEVISGYRTPATNALLRRESGGVARNSLHMYGRAIDIRLDGVALSDLHRAALALRAGGVGYYPTSNFVHVDTGRFRTW